MAGKVFVSCGQAHSERTAAAAVGQVLRDEFALTPYIAVGVQSLGDIMAITSELRSSDYYLFIDFARPDSHVPVSLFTHQELALAHHLGFREQVIALKQRGTPLEGFLKYVQANAEEFHTVDDLVAAVRRLVQANGWHPTYSRNLVATSIQSVTCAYGDHTGSALENVWQVRIENRRPDVAAVSAVCILDSIRDSSGVEVACMDRASLKWAGQIGYERTILPCDFGLVDVLAIRAKRSGIFLHSSRDTPRDPIVEPDGDYLLRFKVFAREFPLLEFEVLVHLRWQPPSPGTWGVASSAELQA